MTDWQPVQGVSCLSPYGGWDRFQPPCDPELDKENGRMEVPDVFHKISGETTLNYQLGVRSLVISSSKFLIFPEAHKELHLEELHLCCSLLL